METKTCFILSFLLLAFTFTWGQNIPSIISPSPQVENFLKFGDYPVNYNTGLPDISIPLYTIKSGNIQVPIVLRYYASGIKPNDEDVSNIGCGWTLDVGGMVAREIRGLSDELYQKRDPFLKADQIVESNSNHYSYLYQVAVTKDFDSEFDQFSYSFLGNSGKFVIEDKRDGTFSAYSYPFKPYKFDIQTGSPPSPLLNQYRSITGIDITDDGGTKFKFGHTNVEHVSFPSGGIFGPSGWFLEEIENVIKSDKVTFAYEAIPEFYASRGDARQVSVVGENGIFLGIQGTSTYSPQPNTAITSNCDLNPSATATYYDTKALSIINFKNGFVQFNLDNSKRHIESIKIYNNQNEIVKSIIFERSLTNSGLQYKLNSIKIRGSTDSPEEKYEFSYSDDLLLNSGPYNYKPTVDYWGYCNGIVNSLTANDACAFKQTNIIYGEDQQASNQGVIATQIGTTSFDPDATSDAHYMKNNLLSRIKYPTGGTTDFDFEPNTYIDVFDATGNPKTGAGLRIKEIKSDDGNGNISKKNYEYEPGFIEYSLLDASNYISITRQVVPLFYDPVNNAPFYFSLMNTAYSNGWNGNLGSNNVYYKKITEYSGDLNSNVGKAVYNYLYENPNEKSIFEIHNSIGTPSAYIKKYKNWGNGQLHTEELFRRDGLNNYSLIKKIENIYEFVPIKTFDNLSVSVGCSYSPTWDTRNDLLQFVYSFTQANLPYPFKYYDYSIVTGAFYLKSKEETDYSNNNLIVHTDYEHNNPNHYYPTKVSTSSSTGEKKVTNLLYVDEFSTTSPYSNLKTLNVLSPVVQQEDLIRNTTNIDRSLIITKTNYNFWSNGWGNNDSNSIIVPQTVQTKTPAQTNYDTRVRFHAYDDKGNISSVSKENDVKKSYIWGYKKSYPIAEATNAGSNEIFFEPFEDGEGWSGTEAQYGAVPIDAFDNTKTHTGKYSARIDKTSGQTVEYCHSDKWIEIGTDAPRKYKYSGWVYSNGPTVYIYLFGKSASETFYYTVVDNIGTTTTNQWVYLEKEFTLPANITKLNIRLDAWYAGGSVWFDDIRVHPSTAQMTTYTYNPLVGMTSQTDVNNKSTYFEYDTYNRLSIIRDNEKNILKKYCYNVYGQTEACTIYSSQEVSGLYYSENCNGQTPNAVNVYVPAGMFSATTQLQANALAQQYAQNYANQYGTCQSPDIELTYSNYSNAYGYVVELSGSNGSYYFQVGSYGSGTLGYIAPGYYTVSIYSYSDYYYRTFTAGCYYYTSGYGSGTLYSVYLDQSCNNIDISY